LSQNAAQERPLIAPIWQEVVSPANTPNEIINHLKARGLVHRGPACAGVKAKMVPLGLYPVGVRIPMMATVGKAITTAPWPI
jgi:hypothetical protein